MKIQEEIIEDLARQIFINLSEQDVPELSEKIGEIVQETQIINELDTEDIVPDVAVLEECYNAFRKDEVVDYKEKEMLLQNAETYNNMYKIPKVM